MNTLLLGGSRFMGVEVVKRLLERGHEVTTFNRGTRRVVWPGHVREIVGDRDDEAQIARLVDIEFEGIIDLSAYNGRQTSKLLRVQGEVQRLVHASTGAVYAPQPSLPWTEQTPYGPWDIWGSYAIGKVAAERVLWEQRPAHFATTVLRLPYVLGPRNYVNREEFVLNRLLDRAEILIPGDGKAVQQFLYITQAAYAFVAALETFNDGGWRAFNIGSTSFVSLEGFVEIAARVVGVDPCYRCVGGRSDGIANSGFDLVECLFPFPNENYVLDLRASEEAELAPPPASLEDMIGAALDAMTAEPARRQWRRTQLEVAKLSGPAKGA